MSRIRDRVKEIVNELSQIPSDELDFDQWVEALTDKILCITGLAVVDREAKLSKPDNQSLFRECGLLGKAYYHKRLGIYWKEDDVYSALVKAKQDMIKQGWVKEVR